MYLGFIHSHPVKVDEHYCLFNNYIFNLQYHESESCMDWISSLWKSCTDRQMLPTIITLNSVYFFQW